MPPTATAATPPTTKAVPSPFGSTAGSPTDGSAGTSAVGCARFPNVKMDDQVDSVSQLLNWAVRRPQPSGDYGFGAIVVRADPYAYSSGYGYSDVLGGVVIADTFNRPRE